MTRPTLYGIVLALTAALALAPAARSGICDDDAPIVIADTVYVLVDDVMEDYLFYVVVYLESNGEPGLQRGGCGGIGGDCIVGGGKMCQLSPNPDSQIL